MIFYITRLERQDDMLLTKLYAYVHALGGEHSEIVVLLGDQPIRWLEGALLHHSRPVET